MKKTDHYFHSTPEVLLALTAHWLDGVGIENGEYTYKEARKNDTKQPRSVRTTPGYK